MGGMQARGDGAGPNAENLGDAQIVEIGVVAKEENKPLTLGQGRDQSGEFRPFLVVGRRPVHRRRRRPGMYVPGVASLLLARRVDDGAPDPSFERRFTAEVAAASDDGRKGVLHGLTRALPLAHDRRRDRDEVGEMLAIERLDLSQIRLTVLHLPREYDPSQSRFV